jgi:hypothetical protein
VKRSEMKARIQQSLYWNKNNSRDIQADAIMKVIEEVGMLPPTTYESRPELHPENELVEINEWEEENV